MAVGSRAQKFEIRRREIAFSRGFSFGRKIKRSLFRRRGPKKRNAILDYGSKMVHASASRGFSLSYLFFPFIIISRVRFVAACTRYS